MNKPHILFVCGRNQRRSPTAEKIYKNDGRVLVRSAGVSNKSKHSLSLDDITRADLIIVFEDNYKSRILGDFRNHPLPPIIDLDIPDNYEFMNDELVALIRQGVDFHIIQLLRK